MEQKYGRSRRRENKNTSTDQLFMRTIRRAFCSMLLCTACLVSSTWAWFVSTAESRVSVIRLGGTTVTVAQEASIYSRRTSIRNLAEGEILMPAGEYIITIEPKTGTAPMYCLIELETNGSAGKLAEEAIDAFNEDMDETWIPVPAIDSNAVRIVDEDELDPFIEEFEEKHEELEYEILPLAVVSDGIYRVDWESGEERTFTLRLAQDALVKMEVFWFTEDEAEDDYPGLDELMGWKYIIVYSKETASSSDAKKNTLAAEPTKAAVTETTAPAKAPTEALVSVGTTTESSAAVKESISATDAAVKETAAAGVETTAIGEGTSAKPETETTAGTDEATKPQVSEAQTTEAESANETKTETAATEIETTETTTEETITPEMSTEEIERKEETLSIEE